MTLLCSVNSRFTDNMQIRKRNESLVRRSITCCFNFSQAPGRRPRKERDCFKSRLKSLGSLYHTLFRTGVSPVYDRGLSNCIPCLGQRGQKNIPYPAARPRIAQIRESLPPPPRGFWKQNIDCTLIRTADMTKTK